MFFFYARGMRLYRRCHRRIEMHFSLTFPLCGGTDTMTANILDIDTANFNKQYSYSSDSLPQDGYLADGQCEHGSCYSSVNNIRKQGLRPRFARRNPLRASTQSSLLACIPTADAISSRPSFRRVSGTDHLKSSTKSSQVCRCAIGISPWTDIPITPP
ncbi:hypothetical protein J6590_080713 [Homalodisca vitripennis]|nr:hypothetical protein J6590_080713 [Homalodisca vitripennis]